MNKSKETILFLCTDNSCRSQMAEAFMDKYNGNRFVCYSAGTDPSRVNPKAIKVMQDKDIDISQNNSKHINQLLEGSFDYVITVCDNARENCPYFSARKKVLHHSFEDPPELEKKY